MNKHTPGPWHTGEGVPYSQTVQMKVCGWDRRPDATGHDYFACGPRVRTEEQAKADARLIAAAPELLEALKRLLEHAEWVGTPRGYSWDDFKDVIDPARAAIAKAEGRSND